MRPPSLLSYLKTGWGKGQDYGTPSIVHGHPLLLLSFVTEAHTQAAREGARPKWISVFAVNGVVTQSPFRQSFPLVPNLHSSQSLRETHGGARGISGGVAPGAGGWLASPLAARSCLGLGGFAAAGWQPHPHLLQGLDPLLQEPVLRPKPL